MRSGPYGAASASPRGSDARGFGGDGAGHDDTLDPLPRSLGPYRLRRRVAEGGSGTVYFATRTEGRFERPLAIKVLRSELAESSAAHRFRAERQILARLEHPNIARLYDGGTTGEGLPFLVLEWVAGDPLDAWCDARRLSVEARLALFLKVCGAVEHAHRHLLVHRDLKPSNILVDSGGEPKLFDFGIAKQLPGYAGTSPGETGTGPGVATLLDGGRLTPAYASPEQLAGRAITTASDVYSLGVILYRLLTGRSPYATAATDPTAAHDLERAICEQVPERASTAARQGDAAEAARLRGTTPERLAHLLGGDLDTILSKALAKPAARRYASVAELAQDLERHLASRPIRARPDSAAYRFSKFARRHRAGLALGALTAMLLVTGLAGLLLERRRLGLEKRRAQEALSFFVEAFRSAQTAAGERGDEGEVSAVAVLDSAARRVERDLVGQPELQAALMDAIGSVFYERRRGVEAYRLFESALKLRQCALGPDSQEVALSLMHVALTRQGHGELASALAASRRAVELFRRARPPDPLALALALRVLGDLLVNQGPSREAEARLAEGVTLARAATPGPDIGGQAEVAGLMLSLGRAKLSLGKDAEAERLYRDAFALQSRLFPPRGPVLLFNEQLLAFALHRLGHAREAEARLRRIAELQRAIPDVHESDVAATLRSLARVRHDAGAIDEAARIERQVLAVWRRSYGPDHFRVAEASEELAVLLLEQGRLAEAHDLALAALALNRRLYGERSAQVAGSLVTLAHFERASGRHDAAIAVARQGLERFVEQRGAEHWATAGPLREIALNLMLERRFGEALPLLQRSHAALARPSVRMSAQLAMTDVLLAKALIRLGRGEEALPYLAESRRRLAAEFGAQDGRLHEIDQLTAVAENLPGASGEPPPSGTQHPHPSLAQTEPGDATHRPREGEP
jgi:serine/threonine-protein kinase